MSSQVWRTVYSTIRLVNRSIPRRGRRTVYPDTLIVAMYFWSVLHDRPLCWAAQRPHGRGAFRPRNLPSRSQFCRRIKSPRCQALLDAIYARLARPEEPTPFSYLDGRALPVGPYTKEPDATDRPQAIRTRAPRVGHRFSGEGHESRATTRLNRVCT